MPLCFYFSCAFTGELIIFVVNNKTTFVLMCVWCWQGCSRGCCSGRSPLPQNPPRQHPPGDREGLRLNRYRNIVQCTRWLTRSRLKSCKQCNLFNGLMLRYGKPDTLLDTRLSNKPDFRPYNQPNISYL